MTGVSLTPSLMLSDDDGDVTVDEEHKDEGDEDEGRIHSAELLLLNEVIRLRLS